MANRQVSYVDYVYVLELRRYMDTIKRRIAGKVRSYEVYTKDEANKLGYAYIEWRHADEGDLAVSDDGYVSDCLSKNIYTDKKGRTKTFIKCAHGVQWVTGKSKFLYEPNKAAGVYSHVKPTRWEDREARTTRAKNAVNAYVTDIIKGEKPDWEMIGKIYRPDQECPEATVRRLFKKQRIVDMVEKKLKEILIDKGITQEQVLDLQLEAIDMARVKGDVSNMLRVADNFMDLLSMKPGKVVTTDTMELDMSNKIIDAIESEDKKLKLERKVEEREDTQ
tara:strand:+ start:406 stop:1239 length:834 start_codon:yes stop_codon:yes gene_type:complete